MNLNLRDRSKLIMFSSLFYFSFLCKIETLIIWEWDEDLKDTSILRSSWILLDFLQLPVEINEGLVLNPSNSFLAQTLYKSLCGYLCWARIFQTDSSKECKCCLFFNRLQMMATNVLNNKASLFEKLVIVFMHLHWDIFNPWHLQLQLR